VQSKGITTPPIYNTRQIGGEPHAPKFQSDVFAVFVDGQKAFGTGNGRNKKDAEKAAAEDALAKLEKQGLL
jgi:ribonuclease-3